MGRWGTMLPQLPEDRKDLLLGEVTGRTKHRDRYRLVNAAFGLQVLCHLQPTGSSPVSRRARLVKVNGGRTNSHITPRARFLPAAVSGNAPAARPSGV